MNRILVAFFTAGLPIFYGLSSAMAMPVGVNPQLRALPKAATPLIDTRPEIAPIAFVRFCLSNEAQCQPSSGAQQIVLTAEHWEQIRSVNANVNAKIMPDPAKGSFDWSLTTARGNCNDYAVQKQKALIEMGFPLSALALTAVVTPWGEGHLVLTVRTDRGDFVLDNLRPNIVAWNSTGYRWLKRQAADNPQNWVALSTQAPLQIAATKVFAAKVVPVGQVDQQQDIHALSDPAPSAIAPSINDRGTLDSPAAMPEILQAGQAIAPDAVRGPSDDMAFLEDIKYRL